jgi:hypothetical protein
MRDYTPDAEALFARFAQRHGLSYEVDPNTPVEVLWTFPSQQRLAHPVTLAFQDNELNFGVGTFWSYYFPFEDVAEDFEAVIDAWVMGVARVVPVSPWTEALQVRRGDGWTTVYRASQLFPRLRRQAMLANWSGDSERIA